MNKDRLRRIMGECIRNERIARSMSIDELAELLELTPGFVGLIERGRRGATAYTLYKLSDIFGLKIDDLFTAPENESLHVAEQSISPTKVKRSKINSMLYDLKEAELSFIISMIKEIKVMNNMIHDKLRKPQLIEDDNLPDSNLPDSDEENDSGIYTV